jgi:hypothetical protein
VGERHPTLTCAHALALQASPTTGLLLPSEQMFSNTLLLRMVCEWQQLQGGAREAPQQGVARG